MEEWTWEMALKQYMAMEDFEGPKSSYHSTHGPLHVTRPTFKTNLSHEFLDACVQLGLPRTNDLNAPGGRYRAGYSHFNARDGVRESAAASYLGPLLDPQTGTSTRRNFHLMLDTLVTRIHINDQNVTTGVEIRHGNGTVQHVRLRKQGQIIVTAGAINTPKLLMLSGLGDRPVLEKLGVPVKKHLARVGWNLQDHPVVGMAFNSELPRSIDLNAELTLYFRATSAPRTQNASSYGLFGSAGLSAGAFLIPPGATVPEIQPTLFPRKSEPHMFESDTLYVATEVVITIALLHSHARSRVEPVHDRTHVHDWIPRVVSKRPQAAPEHVRAGDVWKISWAIGVVREIAAKLGLSRDMESVKNLLGPEITPGRDIASSKGRDLCELASLCGTLFVSCLTPVA
ncbi:hypothetical protein PsorP6_018041 [Peronosclerospora sorghi]|uniref:Uncharacterized protein n=1 Tax=Peronosclerospora sorghi TaxID=230839 RepID=A0ACC0WG29_9STRA|nr:hypothetical protein PsorP6_018041 [Peronosclerospora sorghi]